MTAQVRVGDIGTIFEATVTDENGSAVDISSATTKQMIFKNADGVLLTKTAVFKTTGADGKLQYTSITGDLDLEGKWERQVRVVMPTGEWKSDITYFTVYANLEAET